MDSDLLSAGGGIATSSLGVIGGLALGGLNYQNQKDILNYQKQLQREIFQREDTAIQRRAADIAAAGGNPALAWENGTGASAGSAVGVSAPQFDGSSLKGLENTSAGIYNLSKYFNELDLQDLAKDAALADISKTKTETQLILISQLQKMADIAKTYSEKAHLEQMIKESEYNLDYSIKSNLRTTDSTMTATNSVDKYYSRVSSVLDTFTLDDIHNRNISLNEITPLLIDAGLFLIPGMGIYKGVKSVPFMYKIIKYMKSYGVPKNVKEAKSMYDFLKITGGK